MRPSGFQILTRTIDGRVSRCSSTTLLSEASACGSPVTMPSSSTGCTTVSASRSAVLAASLTASASASRRAATIPTRATAMITTMAPAMTWTNTLGTRTGASGREEAPAATRNPPRAFVVVRFAHE